MRGALVPLDIHEHTEDRVVLNDKAASVFTWFVQAIACAVCFSFLRPRHASHCFALAGMLAYMCASSFRVSCAEDPEGWAGQGNHANTSSPLHVRFVDNKNTPPFKRYKVCSEAGYTLAITLAINMARVLRCIGEAGDTLAINIPLHSIPCSDLTLQDQGGLLLYCTTREMLRGLCLSHTPAEHRLLWR